jgi:hypothetical protein
MDPVTIALTGLLAKKALEGPAARPGGAWAALGRIADAVRRRSGDDMR